MLASVNAFEMVRKWEGLYLVAYPDPATGGDPWTIGWGSTRNMDTGSAIYPGDVIDRATADRWLKLEVDGFAAQLTKKFPNIPFNQNQFDALVSLAYNQGAEFGETLTAAINAKDWKKTAETMALYHHANGKDMQGLINRRNEEIVLFNTPGIVVPIDPKPKPTPEPVKTDTSFWVELYISGNAYVIGNPSGKARDMCDTNQTCANLAEVAKMAEIWKAGKYVFAHSEKIEPIVEKYVPVPEPKPEPQPINGVKSFKKGENVQLSKNIHLSEWECKCSRCTTTLVDMAHVANVQKLRDLIGEPIRFTCAYRCPEHNAEVGGVPNSEHLRGVACDCYAIGLSSTQLAAQAEKVGFGGIGLYISKGFVHLDNGPYGRWTEA